MTVRMIATDLDGTLLRRDKTVSRRTRRALDRARAAGIFVVLVSARPPRTLRILAENAGVGGLAICCNGAIVYDLDRQAVVRHTPFAAAVAVELIRALREAVPGICFGLEQELDFSCEPAYSDLAPERIGEAPRLADALERCAGPDAAPVTKLTVRYPGLGVDRLLRLVRQVGGEAVSVTHSGATFVEVAAPGLDKAIALAGLCADLGVAPEEVVAFGDMPNDLPMLGWAGHGVAVANAHPEVLAATGQRTAANEEDGVALVVERLLGLHRRQRPNRDRSLAR